MAEGEACLIVGPSWVGDMVMAQCLLKALKKHAPNLAIDVLAPRSTAAIAGRMAEARAVIEAPLRRGALGLGARWRTARALRGRYNQAYILPGSLKSALIPWFASIPRRTGYRGEYRYGLVNDLRTWPSGERRRTAPAFQALAGDAPLHEPRLEVDPVNLERLMAEYSLQPGGFVALAPGAEYGPAKRWPAERYGALAARFLGEGRAVAIIGSSGDRPAGEAIAAAAPGALNLCGRTSLLDAVDLLAAASLLVTNDSGLMHVGAAVGVPLVAVYGSTVPDHTPPLSPRAVTLSARVVCAPCFQRTCRFGHYDCLGLITVDMVGEAASNALSRAAGRRDGDG